jgi:DNA-binding winged helix-turn-helix (wHTH) protein/Tol biopolymer transport system component
VAARVFEFGAYRLDCDRFDLSRDGQSLKLERKPMELLILLAAHNGELVTRTEIAQHLWGSDVYVDTEHGINTAVRKIRQVLGDDPEQPHFLQTVTGKGYRFAAAIAPAIPSVPPSAGVRKPLVLSIAVSFCALLAVLITAFSRHRERPPEIRFTQLTDFTDSAVAPALSPDGHMLAFIRGSGAFLSADQIYVRILPDGETRRLTDDSRLKYGPVFSPDGSRVAYTVLDPPGFATYVVPVLGGDSHLLLRNAAGLSWLDQNRLLFSEIRTGIHLGVVSSSSTRSGLRDIYFPAHERGMAHYSYASPDHQRALVVEMDGNGDWAPCRLISLDDPSETRIVGPSGPCTSAGWSPDGSWMYFTAYIQGRSHLWRQHFPDGRPEQLTSGATEEEGIAVEKTGRSVITSVGTQQSALWIHENNIDTPLSSEGDVIAANGAQPRFNQADTDLYYLMRHEPNYALAELWHTTVQSGKSDAVLPGISMLSFDVSSDGKQVVYAAANPSGKPQIWLATLDRSSAPKAVGIEGGNWPHFGANGQILFQQTEGDTNYLERMSLDGSARSKVVAYPIIEIQAVSPGHRWVMAIVPNSPSAAGPAPVAIPVDGESPKRMCESFCVPSWSTDGRFLYLAIQSATRSSAGKTLAIPVGPDESLPNLPPTGIPVLAQASIVKGSQLVQRNDVIPGKDPSHYAYANATVHRNLYRISIP